MTWAVRVHFGAELPNPMAMTRFTPLLCCLLAASSLLGCRTETPAPDDASERAASVTAQSLRMPESHFEGIRQIIERMLIVDDYGDETDELPGMIKTLRSLKVTSTAYYRYLVQQGDDTRVVPGTTPLALGDEALQIKDQKHLIRIGPVQLEIGRKDEPALLDAFSRAYVGFVAEQLGRAGTR